MAHLEDLAPCLFTEYIEILKVWSNLATNGLVLTPEKWNSITRLTLIVFTSNIDPWAAMVENSVWPELFLTEGRVSRHKSLNLQYRHIHNLSNDEMFLLPGKDKKHSGNSICWSFSCFWRLLTFWKNHWNLNVTSNISMI